MRSFTMGINSGKPNGLVRQLLKSFKSSPRLSGEKLVMAIIILIVGFWVIRGVRKMMLRVMKKIKFV